jgi:hypothetical protein
MRKAKYYGKFDRPFVVAANCLALSCDEEDVLDALFGTEKQVVDWHGNNPKIANVYRESDGVWHGPKGPRNTRLSAVIVFRNLRPWNIASRDCVLIINPWANGSVIDLLPGFPSISVIGGKCIRRDGIHPTTLLKLPSGWPEN